MTPPQQVKRWSRWLLVAFSLLVLAACDSSVDVSVHVEEDGSGTVEVGVLLDSEAAGSILDLDTVGLALADLETAGWQSEPPERLESGGLQITTTKAFGTIEQFEEVMAEVSGDARLFQDFQLSRLKGFARVDYAVTGRIDPNGLEPFADAALVDSLERTLQSIADEYGATSSDVAVTLRVELPGDPREEELATGEAMSDGDGTVRVWSTNLAATGDVIVRSSSTTQVVTALVLRGVAIVAAVLALLLVLGQLLRLLRPQGRRGRKKPAAKPKPKPRPEPVIPAEDAMVTADEMEAGPVVVALDGMGVIYREGQDIKEILIPFAREMGSELTEDEIVAKSRALSLGRLTPADFWAGIGIEGDTNELDDQYLSRFTLNPGVIKFLRTLRDQGVQVACLTNDATAWANKLRVRHSLDGLVDPWIVSGAVGVRKPDRPIFEVLRRVTGFAPNQIMVVDDELAILDAARDFGYRTAWFAPEGSMDESNGHAILRSFDVQTPAPTDAPA